MKLFSSTQIAWNEPWFFLIRIREAWGWRRRLWLALGIAVVMFLAIFFFGGGRLSIPGAIGISLAAGFVLVALLDVGNIQREVTVKEDCIIVGTSMGRGWYETFKLDAINAVQLIRPAEWNRPYGGMVIASANDNFLVAVPRKVSLETLADVLHRLGLAASLSEWEPSETDTRIGVLNELELDPTAAQGGITIQPVGPEEGPLLAPTHVAVQIAIAFAPLLLALLTAIYVAVVVFRNWSIMSVLDKSLYAGGAFAAVVLGFMYLVMVGQFVAAAYGIRVARSKLPTRPNAMFTGTEDDLVCIEVFERESWTKTVSQSMDYGFLRIDRSQAKLLFEGNKFRWTLPTSALTACRIEESIVGSEGNPDAERRYFVVIAANHNGQPWEAGMIYTRTELGKDSAETRYQRAQLLFMQLAESV